MSFLYPEVAQAVKDANNLIIIAGADGLTLDGSRALMQAAANFLIESKHVGKPNNGLLATLPGANGMGLHYLGFSPEATVDIMVNPPKVLVVMQADILYDDPNAAEWLDKVETIISLDLFPTRTVERAAVALPIQSFAERDGSYLNGERRVQRFYTAQGPIGQSLPAWQALTRLGEKLGRGRAKLSAAAVMQDITQNIPAFAGASFPELSKVERQFPDVGSTDLYYGGTAYKNTGGLGVQIPTAADRGEKLKAGKVAAAKAPKTGKGKLLVIPTTRLYNRDQTFRSSEQMFMSARTPAPYVEINAVDAKKLGVNDGDRVRVTVDGASVEARARVNGAAPKGAVLLPRNLADNATPLTISAGEVSKA
jgi:NADH-quinone oxidoreductase subunit G